jgi:hypothetical protein
MHVESVLPLIEASISKPTSDDPRAIHEQIYQEEGDEIERLRVSVMSADDSQDVRLVIEDRNTKLTTVLTVDGNDLQKAIQNGIGNKQRQRT